MTVQVPEELILNGKKVPMQFCPPLIDDPNIIKVLSQEELEKEYRDGIPMYGIGTSACWRNYIGTWEIKEGKFYLINLKGYVRLTNKKPVHAIWVSVVLKVPIGKKKAI